MKLLSMGKALPESCVTSEDLDRRLGLAIGTVQRKSGVEQRYFISETDTQAALGGRALQNALDNANISADSIDLLISACAVSEQALPNTGHFIAHAARLPSGTPVFDVNNACLSFVVALEVARQWLLSGTVRRIAIVSVDIPSRGLNWADPESSYIFGDGAAAAIVERDSELHKQTSFSMRTYTEGRYLCQIPAGGSHRTPQRHADPSEFLFKMDGRGVYRLVSEHISQFMQEMLHQVPQGLQSIDCVVPHQASHLGMQHIVQKLKIPTEKLINIYAQHGNQVAASIPTALHTAYTEGRLSAGQRVLLLGTSAGVSIGGLIWEM